VNDLCDLTGTVTEMAKRSIDRRVGRTTQTLHHALISLILKKNYEAITIPLDEWPGMMNQSIP
jgi:hypothetical protein